MEQENRMIGVSLGIINKVIETLSIYHSLMPHLIVLHICNTSPTNCWVVNLDISVNNCWSIH